MLGGPYHRLCRLFNEALGQIAQSEIVLLGQTAPDADLHRLYIPPAGVAYLRDLIEQHGGAPCPAPDPAEALPLF